MYTSNAIQVASDKSICQMHKCCFHDTIALTQMCKHTHIHTHKHTHKHTHTRAHAARIAARTLLAHALLLYVQYHEQPVCTSLLFTLLFIKSQFTGFCFLFLYILLFFLHILLFFCTSHCLLHILLFFAHLIVLHFFISLHILFLFLLFLPYVCPCVMLLI